MFSFCDCARITITFYSLRHLTVVEMFVRKGVDELSKQRRKLNPARLRYHINKNIMKYCKTGDLMNALKM